MFSIPDFQRGVLRVLVYRKVEPELFVPKRFRRVVHNGGGALLRPGYEYTIRINPLEENREGEEKMKGEDIQCVRKESFFL